MAAIDEVKERIGWLKVLFSFAAATVAALMGWLLIQLQEHFRNLRLEDVLDPGRLDLRHAGAFAFILGSYFVMPLLRWSADKYSRRVIMFIGIGLVVVFDLALVAWLVVDLGECFAASPLIHTLNLWHAGAMVVMAYLLIFMLSAMYVISASIKKLRNLQ